MHSPVSYREAALEKFVRKPVSPSMISYLASKASSVIRCEDDMLPPTPPSTPPRDLAQQDHIPPVEEFIAGIVTRSQVQVATLMSSLVYLERLKSRLPTVAKGGRCTVHRIFLACLILSAKNLNDSSPKNKHWAKYSVCAVGSVPFGFSLSEVNLMERQLLALLDFNLRIEKEDLLDAFAPFVNPIAERMHQKYQAALEAQMLEAQRRREPSPFYYSESMERRDSVATDVTHMSIYSAASNRSSYIEYSDVSDSPSSTTSDMAPSLSSGSTASSTSNSTESSPMQATYTVPHIPLSVLSGGPKSKKAKGFFNKLWHKEDDRLAAVEGDEFVHIEERNGRVAVY